MFLVLVVELVVDVPRDRDHKSSKLDADFGAGAGEFFEGVAPGMVGTADIDGRADDVGASSVEVDHKLVGDLLAGGEEVCLLVGESVPMGALANAAGVAGLGACAGKDGLIMGARLAVGGLVLRNISNSVGLVEGRAAGDVGAGEDGAA